MNSSQKLAKDFIGIFMSLNDSLEKASGRALAYEQLSKMTVHDLLWTLAPNGIRFTYNRELVEDC